MLTRKSMTATVKKSPKMSRRWSEGGRLELIEC